MAARALAGVTSRPVATAAALALAVLAACGVYRGRNVATPAATGPLRFGTSGDYSPFSYYGSDGTLAGFDVEVARAYAADRHREVAFVPFRWPELRARLLAGDFDVAMSGITVRGDRLADGIMTGAVARSSAVLVAPAAPRRRRARAGGAAPTPADRTLRAYARPGVRIAVNRGGHLEQIARSRFTHATIVTLDDNRLLPCVLRERSADAIVTDTLEMTSFTADDHCPSAAHERRAAFAVVATLSHDRKAYWLPIAQSDLANDLDEWLRTREDDGTLAALRVRHFGATVGAAASGTLDPDDARLVDLVARRLLLMPLVARAKQAANLPIEDRAREQQVESAAAAHAANAGLDPAGYQALVRAQIEAAKAVQRAADTRDAADTRSLADLRAAIDRVDAAILATAARAVPIGAPRPAVAAALRQDADVPGLEPAVLDPLVAALVELRHAEHQLTVAAASSNFDRQDGDEGLLRHPRHSAYRDRERHPASLP